MMMLLILHFGVQKYEKSTRIYGIDFFNIVICDIHSLIGTSMFARYNLCFALLLGVVGYKIFLK